MVEVRAIISLEHNKSGLVRGELRGRSKLFRRVQNATVSVDTKPVQKTTRRPGDSCAAVLTHKVR